MSSSNAEFHPSRHCRFCKKKKPVTCRGKKVRQVFLYRVVKNKQLVAFTDSESFYFVRCSRFTWPNKAREERTATKRELLYLKMQLLINLCRNRTTAFLSSFGLMVNKIDRPKPTPTVCGICKFAVYFLVFLSAFLLLHSLFMKGISYCFIRRKLKPLDPKIVLRKPSNTTHNTVNRLTRKELNTTPVLLELAKEKETYTSSSRNIGSIR